MMEATRQVYERVRRDAPDREIILFSFNKLARAGERGFTVSAQLGANDVSEPLQSEEGLVLAELLPAGVSATLQVTVSRAGAAAGGTGHVGVMAVWNPQDPSGQIRDFVDVRVAPR